MDFFKGVAISLLVVLGFVFLFGLAFGLEWMGLKWKGYFAPKHENVKREVWEETKSRVHGVTQDVAKKMREYNQTDDMSEKKVIANYLADSYANFNPDKINDSKLRHFFRDCKYGNLDKKY